MSKPNQSRPRRGATLIYDTGAREDDALSRFQWVMPAVFCLSTMLLLFAVLQWQAPQLPVMIFVGVVLVPLSLVLMWKGASGFRRVAKAVAFVAAFGLPLLCWNVGLYRAAALWTVADFMPAESMLRASVDRNELVAAMACERVLLMERSEMERQMRTILEFRPSVARRCLQRVSESDPDVGLRVARYLHHQWFEEWMSGGVMPEETGCEAAAAFADTAPLHGSEGVPELLMCALGASNDTYRSCCSQVVSAFVEGEARLAVRPGAMTAAMRERLFRSLIEAVDLPAATLMGTGPVNENLSWTPGDLFHWTTHLGCVLLDEHPQADAIAGLLSRSIETQCGLEIGDPLYSMAAVHYVRRTCEGAVGQAATRRVDVVEWCEAARGATRVAVVEAARFIVSRALAAYLAEGLEQSIGRGNAHLRREEISQAEHRRQMEEHIRQSELDEDFVSDGRRGGDALRELGRGLQRP